MRSPLILCGAAVLAIFGAPAFAQDAASASTPATACATALDVKTCNDAAAAQVTATTEAQTTMSPTTAPAPATRLYTSTTPGVTNTLVSSGPVPDTAENRAKYGGPKSRAGKRTAPSGN